MIFPCLTHHFGSLEVGSTVDVLQTLLIPTVIDVDKSLIQNSSMSVESLT